MGSFRTLALLAILGTTVYALPSEDKSAKAIGIFNVVRFPNDVCNTETAMNGTCYTAEECSDRDGVATGSCADGFGVCCVISLSCGDTTSENCTYLTQAATAAVGGTTCQYTICPASSTVSRIRLDLTMFNIAAPFGPGAGPDRTGAAAGTALTGGATGQCTMDTFQVTGSGGASPVICGSNDGQHLIVDTDGVECVTAAFSFGLDTTTRNYRIHAIQYDRLNEMGGPAGCLQFFTGMMGTVSSFNFIAADTSTHLANQDYDVCVRRLQDQCTICWSPIITGQFGAIAVQGSFGLSNSAASANAAPAGGVGVACVAIAAMDSNDYIIIPNGVAAANAAAAPAAVGLAGVVNAGADKYCGRYLGGANAAVADGTVCSRVTPFKLSVFTDALEAHVGAAAAMEATNEASGVLAIGGLPAVAMGASPLGTTGFSLGFEQIGC